MGAPQPPIPADPNEMAGEKMGPYRLVELLGKGGMGAVYRAQHEASGQTVAVKVLLQRYCHDREMVLRFFNEARVADRVQHPGIIRIFDAGFHESGAAYLAMALADGVPLSKILDREAPLSLERVCRLGRQIADALEAAHKVGVIHRDLKPDNIVVADVGDGMSGEHATVLDFGIAKLLTEETDPHGVRTQTGALLGSPRYMSPEQCSGSRSIDHRSDIYALGCVLYEMATGRSPFMAPNAHAMMTAHMSEAPRPLREVEPTVPPALDAVVCAALAKYEDERYASMAGLADALDRVREGHTPNLPDVVARRTMTMRGQTRELASPTTTGWAVPIAVGLGLSLAVIVGLAWSSSPSPPAVDVARPPPTTVVETPSPQTVTLSIVSVPPQAAVYRVSDGVRIGDTPLDWPVEQTDGVLELILKREGHRDEKATIPLDRASTSTITLRPIEPKKVRARRGKKRRQKVPPKATEKSRGWGELIE